MSWQDRVRVGTSGWQYDHWVGPFYPEDLPREEWLAFYREHFDTVEVNRSFYALPGTEVFRRWRNTVPERFLFAVKGSRYISHLKKLRDPDEPVGRLLERVDVLGQQSGPVLFQLPPRWHCDLDRLAAFLDVLPSDRRFAFELRDATWHREEVYELLRRHNAALCIFHLEGELSPVELTADFVYLRLHGSEGAYRGRYDVQSLAGWCGAFSAWARAGRDVYCYFDNDGEAAAPADAARMRAMLD